MTNEARAHCQEMRPAFGLFTISISSPAGRAIETARLLSGVEPHVDCRAGILEVPPELLPRFAKSRKSHPFGAAGAIIAMPELREPLRRQGQALVELTKEIVSRLNNNERAVIVSHDGTMAAMEKVLTNDSFDEIDYTYGELEGFRVDKNLHISRL